MEPTDQPYEVKTQPLIIEADYENFGGECTLDFRAVEIFVVRKPEAPIWQKTVAERFIATSIPRPGFAQRVGRAAMKANKLADKLNGKA